MACIPQKPQNSLIFLISSGFSTHGNKQNSSSEPISCLSVVVIFSLPIPTKPLQSLGRSFVSCKPWCLILLDSTSSPLVYTETYNKLESHLQKSADTSSFRLYSHQDTENPVKPHLKIILLGMESYLIFLKFLLLIFSKFQLYPMLDPCLTLQTYYQDSRLKVANFW